MIETNIFHISLLCIHRFSVITHISLFQQRRARFVCSLPVHCGYIWVPQHSVIFYTEVSSGWSPIPHLWDEVAHQAWAARDHLAPVFDLSNARSLLSEQEQKPLQPSPTSAGKHLCCYIHLPAFPPYCTPPCSFFLSSVRSQTNNQIDKYDNISAVLSLKANLQFLGSGSPVVPVLFPIRADQTWASWLRQTIRVSLRSLTPLCSDRGGGGRGKLWQKEDVFLHSARRDWNLPRLWLRRRVALWGKYKQMKRFKRLEI